MLNLAEMYAGGASIPDIALALAWPRSRVRTALIKSGIKLRTRGDGVRLAVHKISLTHAGKKRPPHSAERRAAISRAALQRGEQNAKGFRVTPKGYEEFTRGPNKGRSVHIAVVEQRIGRRLQPGEVVHHIDGNKRNNDEANLALMTRADHTRLHRQQDALRRHEQC